MKRYIATLSYIAMIVLLNVLLVRMPGVAAFGQHFSIADLFVGGIYLVRDFAQQELKHWVLAAMIVGAAISYLLATPVIAIASVAGFLVGESIDWLIFTFSQKPLSQRLITSSIASSPIDSFVFLYAADRLGAMEFGMMTLGKLIGVLLLWFFWKKKRPLKSSRFACEEL